MQLVDFGLYDRRVQTFLERELKLELDAQFELPDLPGRALEGRLFTSVYYDTPVRSLARVGITLRRRLENGVSRWQLKLPRGGAARAEIEELGGPVGPPPGLAQLLVAHTRYGRLEQIATLRTRRTGVRVADGERLLADVTLDSVEVLDAGKSVGSFVELEVELIDGDDEDLGRLARTLRRAGAHRSDGRPKIMRLIELPLRGRITRKTPALEQLRLFLEQQLRELERHDPGVRLGDDAEDLHRFRVATRRSRAVILATRDVLGESFTDLAGELKWLAGLLGPVRDLDVMLEHLREASAKLGPDRAAAEQLIDKLVAERTRHRDALLSGLADERFVALLDRFDAGLAAVHTLSARLNLKKIAARELRKLERDADRLPKDPTDDELHALRKRAKHARYAAELAALSGSEQIGGYVQSLKDLQETIGVHQDAVIAEARLRGAARARTALAAGRLIEVERVRRHEARAAYPAVLRRAIASGRRALQGA